MDEKKEGESFSDSIKDLGVELGRTIRTSLFVLGVIIVVSLLVYYGGILLGYSMS